MNLGYYSRQNVELLVMATRGCVSFMRSEHRDTPQCFYTLFDRPEKFIHSSKPLKSYELLK